MSAPSVHHFGPDPATVGGMASVIRTMTEHTVGADVVQAHSTWRPRSPVITACLSATAVGTLLRLPRNGVAHVHLSERGSFFREGGLVVLARARSLVTVVSIHGASFLPFASEHPRVVAAVLARAHLVSCLDQQVFEVVQRSAPDVRVEIVPNPVVMDTNVTPADQTEELVVFAGEIGLRKGADVVVRAWRLVAERRPQARCVMIGPMIDYMPPSVERLEVRAAVPPPKIKEQLARARVVVLPARAEGMPMILAEAMSIARPFVGTPVGAIPELAAAGGLLVPVDSEHALADRLTDLLADPQLARRIGERGRELCIQTRSIEVLDERWRGLYAVAQDAPGGTNPQLAADARL